MWEDGELGLSNGSTLQRNDEKIEDSYVNRKLANCQVTTFGDAGDADSLATLTFSKCAVTFLTASTPSSLTRSSVANLSASAVTADQKSLFSSRFSSSSEVMRWPNQ